MEFSFSVVPWGSAWDSIPIPGDSGANNWQWQVKHCPHCGGWHTGQCERIKAIEYHENGQIKRVEYKD